MYENSAVLRENTREKLQLFLDKCKSFDIRTQNHSHEVKKRQIQTILFNPWASRSAQARFIRSEEHYVDALKKWKPKRSTSLLNLTLRTHCCFFEEYIPVYYEIHSITIFSLEPNGGEPITNRHKFMIRLYLFDGKKYVNLDDDMNKRLERVRPIIQ